MMLAFPSCVSSIAPSCALHSLHPCVSLFISPRALSFTRRVLFVSPLGPALFYPLALPSFPLFHCPPGPWVPFIRSLCCILCPFCPSPLCFICGPLVPQSPVASFIALLCPLCVSSLLPLLEMLLSNTSCLNLDWHFAVLLFILLRFRL